MFGIHIIKREWSDDNDCLQWYNKEMPAKSFLLLHVLLVCGKRKRCDGWWRQKSLRDERCLPE